MLNWSQAYKLYGPEVLAFLRHRLWGRLELAEDLCQETFARVLGAAVEMRDPSRVRAYLLRTANNLLISHLRRANRVTSECELGPGAEVDSRIDPRAENPHAAAESAQLGEKIRELIDRLPADQKIAFEHGVVERRPYAQIAQEQNWSETKVKVCVYRARKRLMADLHEYR